MLGGMELSAAHGFAGCPGRWLVDRLALCEQGPSPGDALGLPAWSPCPAEGPGSAPPVTVFPVLMVSDSLLVLASGPSPGGDEAGGSTACHLQQPRWL